MTYKYEAMMREKAVDSFDSVRVFFSVFQRSFLSRVFFVFLVFNLNIWVLCFVFARELEERFVPLFFVNLLILLLCVSGLVSEEV